MPKIPPPQRPPPVRPNALALVREHASSPPPLPFYSEQVHHAIVNLVREGQRPLAAAGAVGIDVATWQEWAKAAAAGHPLAVQFKKDVEQAFHVAEVEAIRLLKNDEKSGIDNAKWWLERTRSKEYSQRIQHEVQNEMNQVFQLLQENLTPDEFNKVCLIIGSGD